MFSLKHDYQPVSTDEKKIKEKKTDIQLEKLKQTPRDDQQIWTRIKNNRDGIVVVFGAVLVQLTLGTIFTAGNLGPYLISYLREYSNPNVTSFEMVWINAAQVAGQGALMPIGGMLERKIGPRMTGLIGSAVMSCGTAVTYFSIEYNYLLVLLTYGVIFGLGVSIGYISMIAVGMRWFPEHRGVVNGIIIGAFGFGSFVFNLAQSAFLNPLNVSAEKDGYFHNSGVLDRVPYVFLLLGGIYAVMQIIGCLFVRNPSKDLAQTTVVQPSMSASQVLKTKEFYMLWFTMLFNVQAVTYFNSMYKAYGQTFIQDDRFLALIGAICAVFNAAGRVGWGFLIDKYNYKKCMISLCAEVAALLLTMQFTPRGGKPMFAIWSSLLFLGLAGTYTLISTCISHTFGPKHAGTIYGMVFFNAVIGGPITAFLTQFLSRIIGYTGMFYVLAGFSLISLFITITFKDRLIAAELKKPSEIVGSINNDIKLKEATS